MITIRPECPEDFDSIRRVNESAFGGSIEADIVRYQPEFESA